MRKRKNILAVALTAIPLVAGSSYVLGSYTGQINPLELNAPNHRADNFASSACISHVELYGAKGIRYALQTPDGTVLYSGLHQANRTLFFERGVLPSVTTRLNAATPAQLVIVTADAPQAEASTSAANAPLRSHPQHAHSGVE